MTVVASQDHKVLTGVSRMRRRETRVIQDISSSSATTDRGRSKQRKTAGFSVHRNSKSVYKLYFQETPWLTTISPRQIAHVIANSDGEYPGVGVLGSNNRDVWAKVRNDLFFEGCGLSSSKYHRTTPNLLNLRTTLLLFMPFNLLPSPSAWILLLLPTR